MMGDGNLFAGRETCKTIVYNVQSLLNNKYLHAGQLMAMSIFQGGSGPCCLAESLYGYIVTGLPGLCIDIADISDPLLQEDLLKVCTYEYMHAIHSA